MDRNELLERLLQLNPAELAIAISRLGIRSAILPGSSVAPAQRAIAVLEWCEARRALTRLQEVLERAEPAPTPSVASVVKPQTRDEVVSEESGDLASVTLLHLSDLHFHEDRVDDILVIFDAFWKDLESYSEETGLSPDLICFTGDMAHSGRPEQFELAAEHLFEPLLRRFGLGRDRLLWAPGNHDVDRAQVKKFREAGYLSLLKDRRSVNNLLDDVEERDEAFARLSAYAEFTRDYMGALLPEDQHPDYFTTRVVEVGGLKLGVACLNSAWRCSSDADKGRLWIGDRQRRAALRALGEVDLRIALMHHPFDWLHTKEAREAEDFCVREFDVVLRGHLHDPRVSYNHRPDGHCLILPTGALYQGRGWEGYSWVHLTSKQTQVHLRRYIDERDKFVPDERTADGGLFTVPFVWTRG